MYSVVYSFSTSQHRNCHHEKNSTNANYTWVFYFFLDGGRAEELCGNKVTIAGDYVTLSRDLPSLTHVSREIEAQTKCLPFIPSDLKGDRSRWL